MDERVKKYIAEKIREAEERKDTDKADFLIEHGLYEEVFAPNGKRSEEYNLEKWEDGTYKPYKKVPIPVTDEEYDAIRRVTKQASAAKKGSSSNPVATALGAIAWFVYVGGFIGGIPFLADASAIAIGIWCSALISGTMFLGFAEIIKLLTALKNM